MCNYRHTLCQVDVLCFLIFSCWDVYFGFPAILQISLHTLSIYIDSSSMSVGDVEIRFFGWSESFDTNTVYIETQIL